MSEQEIQNYVRKCPYFGSPKTIDSMSYCKLEFHYRAICPSPKCLCAKKLGWRGEEDEERLDATEQG